MLLKTILNRIHPLKGFVYDRFKFVGDQLQKVVVEIRHRTGSKRLCSVCGKRKPGYDHLPARSFDFIPIWNIPVSFECAQRRVSCPVHGVIVESLHHKTLITNWFAAQGQLTSGIVAAMNNTAKLTISKSYGFRQYGTLEYALYHKLGDLPVPIFTHEFFFGSIS